MGRTIASLSRDIRLVVASLFFVSFSAYVHIAAPTVAQYRDAGEMATSGPLLGILHPPGYPLYSLLSKLACSIPLGNAAYRLNIFSGAAVAMALVLIVMLLRPLFGLWASLIVTVALGGSGQFLILSGVSEMYTLNILLLAGSWYALDRGCVMVGFYVMGLGLANRIDMLLAVPGVLVAAMPAIKRSLVTGDETNAGVHLNQWSRAAPLWILATSAGASPYLYLPLRALQAPWINWGDPSTFSRFVRTVTRAGYGKGLDLLSQSYSMGENFGAQWKLFGRHLLAESSWVGIALAVIGLIALARRRSRWALGVGLGFILTGPAFLFLGNLPPNPHAVAIMEASYLMPDLFFAVACAAGLASLLRRAQWPAAFGVMGLGVVIALAWMHASDHDRRDRYFAWDFMRNTFHDVPAPSFVTARSDVPLFSLYYGYWVQPARAEVVPVAQGLAGATWYQDMMRSGKDRSGLLPLKTADDWRTWSSIVSTAYGTFDVDWPGEVGNRLRSQGLVLALPGPNSEEKENLAASQALLQELCIYRGRYRYNRYHEFFAPELIEEYAKAWTELGGRWLARGATAEADWAMHRALVLKPDFQQPAIELGYLAFKRGRYQEARRYYRWSVDLFSKLKGQSISWNALPATRISIDHDFAGGLVDWGATEERLDDRPHAMALYDQALGLDPTNANALFNKAVLYWHDGQWANVVESLETLLLRHPEDPRARAYLPAARSHLGRAR